MPGKVVVNRDQMQHLGNQASTTELGHSIGDCVRFV